MKDNNRYILIVTIIGENTENIINKLTNYNLIDSVSIGQKIIRKGKFIKYSDSSYNSLLREIQLNENWNVVFNELLDFLFVEFQDKVKSNSLKIILKIAITYKNQCNFELKLSEMEKLCLLNASFALSTNSDHSVLS